MDESIILFFLQWKTSSCPFAAKSSSGLKDCPLRSSKENERYSSTVVVRRLKLQDQCSQLEHHLVIYANKKIAVAQMIIIQPIFNFLLAKVSTFLDICVRSKVNWFENFFFSQPLSIEDSNEQ